MNKKRYLIIVGVVVAVVLISILCRTMLTNHQPAITSLAAEPEGVPPLGRCQIACNASDPDGDELSYNWSASGGNITGTGESVNWTAPDSAGSYNVTVTVTDGRGGEVTDNVTIKVRTNTPPTINSLIANADWTTPSGSLQVTCNAADSNRDELRYEWTATGGKISGTGAAINWAAPQEVGAYNITVVVKDGYGGEARRLVILTVVHGTPPTIENLIVTAKGHQYLRQGSEPGCDYDVWIAKEYDIQCKVADTSVAVSYTWSCDDGQISEISEDGSVITWTAPAKTLTSATVTVIVSDVTGNKAGKSIYFYVPSCACGF